MRTALDDAQEGAFRMPSRHGLVAYTTTDRGDRVYLTQERWLHIREYHMDPQPQPRGKRTTTYWPTRHAVERATMTDQQVISAIVDSVRKGTLRTEVRDTRMAEYDLPWEQAKEYGVSEVKVSMAPDGLILSSYPGAGENVLAVYELGDEDHAEFARASTDATSQQQPQAVPSMTDGEQQGYRSTAAATTFG
jgi:hypothetical protein